MTAFLLMSPGSSGGGTITFEGAIGAFFVVYDGAELTDIGGGMIGAVIGGGGIFETYNLLIASPNQDFSSGIDGGAPTNSWFLLTIVGSIGGGTITFSGATGAPLLV